MRWLNEPHSWSAEGSGLTVRTDAHSDFWRKTHYGFDRDNGHVYGLDVTGNCRVEVSFEADYATQYDQAGVMLRVDESNWVKAGVEYVDGGHLVSAVFTRDFSDWSMAPLAGLSTMRIVAIRQGDTVTLDYSANGEPMQRFRLGYLKPGVPVLAGAMCASPDGEGCDVRFSELSVIEQ